MANIDAQAGLARARTHATNRIGYCFAEVSTWYNSPAAIGPGKGNYGIAYNQWVYSADRHPGDYNPPVGVAVVFGPSPTRTDRNKNAGDIAISMGGGLIWCTDVTPGRTGVMTIAARARQTARPYMGWTGDFVGHKLVNIGPVLPINGKVLPNAQVKDEQAKLNAAGGYNLAVDGIRGPKTIAAITDFQKKHPPLAVDGIVGPKTLAVLNQVLAPKPAPAPAPAPGFPAGTLHVGSTGAGVLALQRKLRFTYPAYARHLVLDGIFGKGTEAVVREFQRRAGLVVDGIVGPQTKSRLGI